MRILWEHRDVARRAIPARAVGGRWLGWLVLFAMPLWPGSLVGADEVFLSDPSLGATLTHHQQWGQFGRDTAAAAPGRAGSPIRIGQRVFSKGLGHHANGEIAVALDGRFTEFRATVGVQWQGGNRGSVVFEVIVDGRPALRCGPLSDSGPAREVRVELAGARQLRLVARDGGDGIACDMANWAEARLVRDPNAPWFGTARAAFGDRPAPPASAEWCGFSVIAGSSGPQAAVMTMAGTWTANVRAGETVRVEIPVSGMTRPWEVTADVAADGVGSAEVAVVVGGERQARTLRGGDAAVLRAGPVRPEGAAEIVLAVRGVSGDAAVRWRALAYRTGESTGEIRLRFDRPRQQFPPPVTPELRPAIERELIEWDWRMQDGIGTPREPRRWAEALCQVFRRGDRLIADLTAKGVPLGDRVRAWEALRVEWETGGPAKGPEAENLWRRVHRLRRQLVFANPLAQLGAVAFIKRVPSCFSHQLTQYYGMCARPGGGVFVLHAPGRSMRCRPLVALPPGSYQHLDVSWDGRRVLFAYCQADSAPPSRTARQDRFYHLFEVAADGSGLRQLTDGPYDDFAPRYLPDGRILFVSTRRGGYHRCGAGPCPIYTLTVAEPDGSNPRVISFHETHEWDPAVLHDGRVIYTRWDYVDRHAVYYEQLWTMRPDGTGPAAFFGNNTFNPVGLWEARPVPRSRRVMATAAAHHAMTAGSVVLVDTTRGADGLEPITRLTPDVLFPESESPVQRWHAPAGVPSPPPVPPEQRRWPGHCYRTPCPLSEDYFLAAYSYDELIGEPSANQPNMFGLYLVDRFGNKELIYRDVGISSLWAMPLRPRTPPPVLGGGRETAAQEGAKEQAAAKRRASAASAGRGSNRSRNGEQAAGEGRVSEAPLDRPAGPASAGEAPRAGEGTFFVQNVYLGWPPLDADGPVTIRRLRILQVLPKTTPHINAPRVGLANASAGKQVLGTVPVEQDGSAWFRAPAGVPLAFQALDERGMAVQTMRSLTYLQPGEQAACVGCHESRAEAPPPGPATLASLRGPSPITPGPDGSRPFSYPLLVQPVLDRHCVRCHRRPDPDGKLDLTGTPDGPFTASYNALAPLVPFSEWKSTPQANGEPRTRPNQFGARASPLMALLSDGHYDVTLSPEELERLITWMDANALFYGTFDPADQKRQQQGERIAGPALQ